MIKLYDIQKDNDVISMLVVPVDPMMKETSFYLKFNNKTGEYLCDTSNFDSLEFSYARKAVRCIREKLAENEDLPEQMQYVWF